MPLSTDLHIVLDASGSMCENGKIFIARGLLRAAEQYFRLGYGEAGIQLVLWNETARAIPWDPDSELPGAAAVNAAPSDATALTEYFRTRTEGGVLLISDGFWSRKDIRALRQWKEQRTPGSIRVVLVGADAHLKPGKSAAFSGDEVFSAEELFAALEGFAAC